MFKHDDVCPYCSYRHIERLGRIQRVSGKDWSMEMLCHCPECVLDFYTTYSYTGNYPLNVTTLGRNKERHPLILYRCRVVAIDKNGNAYNRTYFHEAEASHIARDAVRVDVEKHFGRLLFPSVEIGIPIAVRRLENQITLGYIEEA